MRDDIVRPDELKVYLAMTKRSPKKQCMLAMLGAYGKRVSEVCAVSMGDIAITSTHLVVRFTILKTRPRSGMRSLRNKPLSKKHWLFPFIENYIQNRTGHLWPSYGKTGHITRWTVRNWLKDLNEDLWPHLFRHSLAVQMAEHGANVAELMAWFDWESEKTAIGYVMRYGKARDVMAKKWSDRTF